MGGHHEAVKLLSTGGRMQGGCPLPAQIVEVLILCLNMPATCRQNSNLVPFSNQLCKAVDRAVSTIDQAHALPGPALGTPLLPITFTHPSKVLAIHYEDCSEIVNEKCSAQSYPNQI